MELKESTNATSIFSAIPEFKWLFNPEATPTSNPRLPAMTGEHSSRPQKFSAEKLRWMGSSIGVGIRCGGISDELGSPGDSVVGELIILDSWQVRALEGLLIVLGM